MSEPSVCRKKALDLLARRPHFRRELAAKLARRGFPAVEVEAVCERLAACGLLDDVEAARGMALGPLQRKGYGPLRVRAELRRRGAPDEAVSAALAELFAGGEMEPALAQARRWLERRPPDAARLARHLSAKGYGESCVRRVLDRLGLAPGAG